MKSKVNLIPLNAAAGIPFERPSDAAIDRFARILAERGLTVSVRKSRGRDIRAACGQLIVEGQKRRPASSWRPWHSGSDAVNRPRLSSHGRETGAGYSMITSPSEAPVLRPVTRS